MESGDESNDNSIMPPLLSKEEIDTIDSGDESEHDLISTDTLENIRDRSQSHPKVQQREARYKIRDCIRQRQPEWKEEFKTTRSMRKGLHKVFSTVVKEILQDLPSLG